MPTKEELSSRCTELEKQVQEYQQRVEALKQEVNDAHIAVAKSLEDDAYEAWKLQNERFLTRYLEENLRVEERDYYDGNISVVLTLNNTTLSSADFYIG